MPSDLERVKRVGMRELTVDELDAVAGGIGGTIGEAIGEVLNGVAQAVVKTVGEFVTAAQNTVSC
jgi:hypothetical protein